MNNTLTIPKVNIWKLSLLVLGLGVTIGLIVAKENFLFLGVLFGLSIFIFFVRNPELPLAVLFNGTFIYFYSVWKLGFETSTLITGSFYGFLAVSYILGGILLLTKKPQGFRLKSIDVLFIFFYFMVFLSYLIFHTGSETAYKKITYAPLLVIAPYFGIRLLTSQDRIKRFFKYCIFVAAILIVPAFYELFFNPIFADYTRFSMYMFEGTEGTKDNPILFGITFAVLFLILFEWILEQRRLKFKYLLLIFPSVVLLLRSGSRGAVISFLVVILFYIFIMGNLEVKIKAYAAIFVALLIWGAYKFIPESLVEFYQYSFTVESREAPASSIYQRLTMWEQAINDFKENPIFGVGTGNSVGGIGFPHNILLETAAEFGLIGLLILILMLYLTIMKAIAFIKREKDKNLNLLMRISLLLFIYFLVEAMFSGHVTNQTRLFMSMGLIVSLLNLGKGKSLVVADQRRKNYE